MNIKTAIWRAAGSVIKSARKNKSTIISIGAVIGVGVTAVLAVKGSEDLRDEASTVEWDEMAPAEKTVRIAKHLGPALISWGVTATAILVNEHNHKQFEASLIATCAGSTAMLQRFRDKMEDIYGPEAVQKIDHAISEDFVEYIPANGAIHMPKGTSDEEVLFHLDDGSRNGVWFYSTLAFVKDCGMHFNRNLALRGWAELSELIGFYFDGENTEDLGQGIGWSLFSECGYAYVDIAYDFVQSNDDDTPPFYRIIFLTPPTADYLS